MIEIKQIQPSETWQLRHRVMWADKPFDDIKLPNDDDGLHFGLFNDGILLSVVSVFIENNSAQFRKFATEISEQGKGYGAKLLNRLIQECINQNITTFWCNARTSVSGFYEKFGLTIVSDAWIKDGIEYVKMSRNL